MNPYYQMLRLTGGERNGWKLALGTLTDYAAERFFVEGEQAAVAGRAGGLTIRAEDEGASFLCLGNRAGWFVLCRLEET